MHSGGHAWQGVHGGGVHGRGMCGRERACVTGKMVIAVGGTGKWQLQWAVHILLECILVSNKVGASNSEMSYYHSRIDPTHLTFNILVVREFHTS